MSAIDMTEQAAIEHWEMREAEACPCGGHFETRMFKTVVLLCHRDTGGRLLCTGMTHANYPMRRGDPPIDPWKNMHDELVAAAHGGSE